MHRLEFDARARKEFEKLGHTVRQQFQKKLLERLANPRVVGDALTGMKNCYKIKLRSVGYRLIYQVDDHLVTVLVISVAGRDAGKDDAYDIAKRRVDD